jgi:hypothetical protein
LGKWYSTGLPPKPRPFDITEPFENSGVWCFWLTADVTVLQLVAGLNCILYAGCHPSPATHPPHPRVLYTINPRYDHQEAWLWIYDLLEVETKTIELNELWEDALSDVCHDAPEFDDLWG